MARYPRTLANLAIAVRQADAAILYDSQAIEAGTHKAVAVCKGDVTQVMIDRLPKWAQLVLGSSLPGKN